MLNSWVLLNEFFIKVYLSEGVAKLFTQNPKGKARNECGDMYVCSRGFYILWNQVSYFTDIFLSKGFLCLFPIQWRSYSMSFLTANSTRLLLSSQNRTLCKTLSMRNFRKAEKGLINRSLNLFLWWIVSSNLVSRVIQYIFPWLTQFSF